MNSREPMDKVSSRQLAAMTFVGALSPLVRRYPRDLARMAGRCGWLSPILAAPFAGLLLLLLGRLLRRGRPGLLRRAEDLLSPGAARVLSGLLSLWLLFYAGFLLRSGALRVVSAAYPGSGPDVFILTMALACGWSAGGGMRAVGRSAAVLRPLMAAALLGLPLLALRDMDLRILFPVTAPDLAPALGGGFALVNLLAASSLPALVCGGDREGPPRLGSWVGWGGILLLLLTACTAACLALFGPTLTGKFSYPIFMLARDVTVLGELERAEPLLVCLWVLSDFICISALLRAAAITVSYAAAPDRTVPPGRLLPAFCAAAACGIAFFLPEETNRFAFLSERVVPISGAVAALGIPLGLFTVGTIRKRI